MVESEQIGKSGALMRDHILKILKNTILMEKCFNSDIQVLWIT